MWTDCVLPVYSHGQCNVILIYSGEELAECVWLTYTAAYEKLKWDSNRTALYELKCRLEKV